MGTAGPLEAAQSWGSLLGVGGTGYSVQVEAPMQKNKICFFIVSNIALSENIIGVATGDLKFLQSSQGRTYAHRRTPPVIKHTHIHTHMRARWITGCVRWKLVCELHAGQRALDAGQRALDAGP